MTKQIKFLAIHDTWITNDRLVREQEIFVINTTSEEKGVERAMATGSVGILDELAKARLNIPKGTIFSFDTKQSNKNDLSVITGIGKNTIPKLKNIGIDTPLKLEKAIKTNVHELVGILKAQLPIVKKYFGVETIEDDEADQSGDSNIADIREADGDVPAVEDDNKDITRSKKNKKRKKSKNYLIR